MALAKLGRLEWPGRSWLAARNPRTGEIIQVPARRKTHFKPGKELKEGLHAPPDPSDNVATTKCDIER